MQRLVLRARSSCALCGSRLPPRTEAWQDEADGTVTCLTCELMERSDEAPPVAPSTVRDLVAATPTPSFVPAAAPAEVPPSVPAAAVTPEPVPADVARFDPPDPAVAGGADDPTAADEGDADLDIDAPPAWAEDPDEPPRGPGPGGGIDPSAAAPASAPGDADGADSPAVEHAAVLEPVDAAAPTPVDGTPPEVVPVATTRPVGRRTTVADAAGTLPTERPVARRPLPVADRPVPPPAPTPRRRRDDEGRRETPTPRRRRTDRLAPEAAPPIPERLTGTPDPAGPAPEGLVHPRTPEAEAMPSVPMHHAGPTGTDLPDGPPVADPRRREAVTSLVGRLRPVHGALDDLAERTDRVFDRILDAPAAPPSIDPSLALPLHRGDMGEGRVGQTLEAARIQGLEVLHGVSVVPGAPEPVDHLVVAVNGVWVVRAVPVLTGRLERRDLGDWFNADPRLFVADEDRSVLVAGVRAQVEATTALLADNSFADIPVRGVICFGSIQPGWVHEPFVLDGVSITWRSRLVEPMLDPVLVDVRSRTAVVHSLAASVTGSPAAATSAGGAPAGDGTHQAAG